MSGRAGVALYVAVCAKCGGGWGAVSTSVPPEDLASTLAAWVADGAELHPFGEAQRAEYLESMRRTCDCPESATSHEAASNGDDWPDSACPECGAPVAFPGDSGDCRECGAEWSREAVFTLYAFTVTKPGDLSHACVRP